MKVILLVICFIVEVACYTIILNLYDWKAFVLAIFASLSAGIIAIIQNDTVR